MATQTFVSEKTVQLEEVQALASNLAPLDKLKLLEHLAKMLENELIAVGVSTMRASEQSSEHPQKPRRSLLGIWSDWGSGPSAEEIDEVRREMWANFPREDI